MELVEEDHVPDVSTADQASDHCPNSPCPAREVERGAGMVHGHQSMDCVHWLMDFAVAR